MDISVVILTYNEEKNIDDCLNSVLNQKYFNGRWEALVVDGNSTDNTIKIIKDKQKESDHISLLNNKNRKIASGRNIGIRESLYPFIAFTDADCIVPDNWLYRLSQEYEKLLTVDDRTTGVGGGNMPLAESNNFQKALGLYLDSFIGCFNSPQGRNFSQIKKVDSLACLNVLYNKQILGKVGGFDEEMGNIAEDLNLNLRLKENGYNLYFIPNISVEHKLRPNLTSWLKNMALYGKGRAIISHKHNLYSNFFFILPLLFAVSIILIPLCLVNPIFFLPLLYFPVICFYVLGIVIKKRNNLLFVDTLIIFVSTHFVYAFNLLSKFLQICFYRIFGLIMPKLNNLVSK